mgnify:CR=1 FL=1
MVKISEESKRRWKEHGKQLFWNCPQCEDVEMVQYRSEENPGMALCPECLTVYHPEWEVAVESPEDM